MKADLPQKNPKNQNKTETGRPTESVSTALLTETTLVSKDLKARKARYKITAVLGHKLLMWSLWYWILLFLQRICEASSFGTPTSDTVIV